MQHGDPYVKALVKHILNQVAEPIKIILSRWIYEGELDDAFNEVCNACHIDKNKVYSLVKLSFFCHFSRKLVWSFM